MRNSTVRAGTWPGLLLSLLLHQLTGCTPPPLQRVVLATGFEQGRPVPGPLVLNMVPAVPTREQAHTGQWAAKIDQRQRDILLCSGTWQALGRPHHLRVRLWVWLPNGRQNAAILQVSGQRASPLRQMPGNPVSLEQLSLDEVVRHYRCWVLTTLFVRLPNDLLPTDHVAVCIWGQNPGADDTLYFDDVAVENAD